MFNKVLFWIFVWFLKTWKKSFPQCKTLLFSSAFPLTVFRGLPKSVLPNNKHHAGHNEREFYSWLFRFVAHSLFGEKGFYDYYKDVSTNFFHLVFRELKQ